MIASSPDKTLSVTTDPTGTVGISDWTSSATINDSHVPSRSNNQTGKSATCLGILLFLTCACWLVWFHRDDTHRQSLFVSWLMNIECTGWCTVNYLVRVSARYDTHRQSIFVLTTGRLALLVLNV